MVDLQELSKKIPILDYDHGDEPLWGSDTGRNTNSGNYSGTFTGYFPQIAISFGKTTQSQMTIICDSFEHPVITMKYKNKNTGSWISQDFYGTAIHGKLDNWDGKYHPFSITLTAVKKKV